MDLNENAFPVGNGDIPASYVSLPEGYTSQKCNMDTKNSGLEKVRFSETWRYFGYPCKILWVQSAPGQISGKKTPRKSDA